MFVFVGKEATKNVPSVLEEIINVGNYTFQRLIGLFLKKIPTNTYLAGDETSMPRYKAAKDRHTFNELRCDRRFENEKRIIFYSENKSHERV